MNLYNYETQVIYLPENVDRGYNYLVTNSNYEVLIKKDIGQKYFNNIGVCLKYLNHSFSETSDDATTRLQKQVAKLLSRKWIRYIPNTTTKEQWIHSCTTSQDSTSIPQTSKKYYAVKVGRQPGIYTTWSEACEQVINFSNAIHKSFLTLQEAERFLQ